LIGFLILLKMILSKGAINLQHYLQFLVFYFIRGNYLLPFSNFHKISFSKNPYQPRVTLGRSEPTFGPQGNRSSPEPEPSAKGKDRTIEETPVPLEGRQQKPTTLWAFQVERFRWRQSRGVHMVLEKH